MSHTRLIEPMIFIAVLMAWLAGCGRSEAKRPSNSPQIACTVGMVGDIVRNVVGEHGEVVNIIGEGVDPHLYFPTRRDILQIQQADVVFYCGLMLEGKMAEALGHVARRGKPVHAVAECVDAQRLRHPEGFDGHPDPHLWMDVALWSEAVEAVAEAMCSFDAAHASEYRANAAALRGELETLDAYARTSVASIPEDQRVLITAHDAFGYFGRAYGIEVEGIQGISTESEAGLHDRNRLVDLIFERQVRSVFVETSVSEKQVQALVEGAAARGHSLQIGGRLFSDAMGKPGTYEGTYIGMLDHNVTTITRALGGVAPPRGMQGRLEGTLATEPEESHATMQTESDV